METNPTVEAAGRGLRASVVLASLAICLVLFWGMKSLFHGGSKPEDETTPARHDSFSVNKHKASSLPPSEPETQQTAENQAGTTAAKAPIVTQTPPTIPSAGLVPNPAPQQATVEVLPPRSSGAASDFGMLSGKVMLEGIPEPEKLLPLDPTCGRLHPNAKPTTQFYVVAADGGLADVFVYISKGMENRRFLPPANPLVLDQVGCIYTPYVAGAMTGQTIEVRNSDPVLHNVHPIPAVEGNRESNKAHLPKSPPILFKWDNPELFLKFKCDVHPWMFAYVSLLPHPYFAVTDASGAFTIPDVPPGKYVLTVLHRKAGSTDIEVTVGPGENSPVAVRLKPPQ